MLINTLQHVRTTDVGSFSLTVPTFFDLYRLDLRWDRFDWADMIQKSRAACPDLFAGVRRPGRSTPFGIVWTQLYVSFYCIRWLLPSLVDFENTSYQLQRLDLTRFNFYPATVICCGFTFSGKMLLISSIENSEVSNHKIDDNEIAR